MFLVYATLIIILVWDLFLILNKYFLEYTVIEFDKDNKLRLSYTHERMVLVNKIAEIAGNVG